MLTISNPTISKTVVNTGERFIVSVEVTSKMTWAELKKRSGRMSKSTHGHGSRGWLSNGNLNDALWTGQTGRFRLRG